MNKIMLRVFIIFFLINLADLITSYFILGGEANPLYLMFGSVWPLYILKIAVTLGAFIIIRKNEYGTHFSLYMMIVFMLYGIVILGFGVFNNMQGILNPSIIEVAKTIPNEVKIKAYTNMVILLYYIPAGITLLSFKVYEWAVVRTTLPNLLKKGDKQ
jgi:uncharacterized membrane protein